MILPMPAYIFAGIVTCIVVYYADRLRTGGIATRIGGYERGWGDIILTSRNVTLTYVAIHVAAAGDIPDHCELHVRGSRHVNPASSALRTCLR